MIASCFACSSFERLFCKKIIILFCDNDDFSIWIFFFIYYRSYSVEHPIICTRQLMVRATSVRCPSSYRPVGLMSTVLEVIKVLLVSTFQRKRLSPQHPSHKPPFTKLKLELISISLQIIPCTLTGHGHCNMEDVVYLARRYPFRWASSPVAFLDLRVTSKVKRSDS